MAKPLSESLAELHQANEVKLKKFQFYNTSSINADMGSMSLVVYSDNTVVGAMDIVALLDLPQKGTLYLSGTYEQTEQGVTVTMEGKGYFSSLSYGTKAYSQQIVMELDADWTKGTIPSLGTDEVVHEVH